MNVLFLAPHPFYQERGTPIAARLLLQVLSRRGDHVDVLTYHEGEDVALPGVVLHRIPRLPGIRNIRPGFSLKKLVCDVFLLGQALRMVRRKHYHLVHAVEEGAFIGLLIKRSFGIPYVYDMDSSMSQQMVDKTFLFQPVAPVMRRLEGRVIRQALVVVPVCDALAEIARRHRANKIWLLRDVSLLSVVRNNGSGADDLRLAGIRFMYIGNLEPYQGIDLLLSSFSLFHKKCNDATLVIVGGAPRDIARYQAIVIRYGIDEFVRFTGPRPLSMMAGLFRQTDILVSPRIRGVNTPMKIYSYLQSGKPILATDLPTHTQVLTPDVALLAPPGARRFAEAMRRLADDPDGRELLARRAAALAEKKYSLPVFERSAYELYQWLEAQILP
jgi:glycosyltransferase involved in cell wall biosynthesis